MTQFEIYSLILSVIVFTMLVGMFGYLLYNIVILWFKQIKFGLNDEEIIREFENVKKENR